MITLLLDVLGLVAGGLLMWLAGRVYERVKIQQDHPSADS